MLIALSLFPVVNISHGTGNRAAATNPSKLEAHPAPSLVYTAIRLDTLPSSKNNCVYSLGIVNNGNTAASPYLARLFALIALATVKPL